MNECAPNRLDNELKIIAPIIPNSSAPLKLNIIGDFNCFFVSNNTRIISNMTETGIPSSEAPTANYKV